MKQQIIYIGWWEAKENYKNFMDYLEKLEFNPYTEKFLIWSKYLQEDLWDDFEVINIPMPNKHFALYDEWKIIFEKVFPYLRENVFFVGHSLWATFLVKYFNEEKIDFLFKKIFLLAPAFQDSEAEVIWSFHFDKKLEKLQKFAEKIMILHSKDDFVVPYTDFLEFKKSIPKAKYINFEDKNHFLDREFPEIINYIKEK